MKKAKLTEHERVQAEIPNELLASIRKLPSPSLAAEAVLEIARKEGVPKACAVIDASDLLTAAFILKELKLMIMLPVSWKDGDIRQTDLVRRIVFKAEQLQIRGVKGLCHARDEIYRITGVFGT